MSRRTKVFLSYARDDASDLVKRVRTYLEPAGTEAWVDVLDIPAGVDWRQNLDASIHDCDALVLIMTPEAIESKYVKEEYQIAQGYQKRVIPLAMSDVKVPNWLNGMQYIRFKQFDDATALGKLTGDLKSVWESVEQRLASLRINVVGDELTPILDHLETYLKVLPRPLVRPEVLLACAEFTERMTLDSAKRPLIDLIADWRDGNFQTSTWTYGEAYEKNKRAVKKILDQALKAVATPEVETVPFVLVVMTAQEAVELQSETAFDATTESLRVHYKNVLKKLESAGLKNWTDRYQGRPEDWKPFDAAGKTLEQLIAMELAPKAGGLAKVLRRPTFIDIRSLGDRFDELDELRKAGCVVVMDVVSVCHPRLLMAYRRSLLDIFPTTFLIKMAPLEPVPVYGKAEDELMTLPWVQKADSFFYERHMIQLDPKCHVAGQEAEFRRFMREKVVTSFLSNYAGFRRFVHGGGT